MSLRQPSTNRRVQIGLLVLLAAAVACGGDDTTEPAADAETPQSTVTQETLDQPVLPEGTDPGIASFEDFKAATFSNPTVIDNQYLPLAPGNRIVLSGTTLDEGEELAHQVRYVVTDLTKEIVGIQTVVVWIEDYSDDELVEVEIAFYAQDDAGNVWFFGEHPEEYEDEELIGSPTWIAGVDGAFPGIAMHAGPEAGGAAYFQGWGPAVEWNDFAQVESIDDEICIELGCFPGSITIAESSLDEEGIAQVKSYAPGIGNIEVGFRGDDQSREEMEVVDHSPVSESDLATFRVLAKVLENSAYRVSPDAYGATAPME